MEGAIFPRKYRRDETTLLLCPWVPSSQRPPVIEANKSGACLDVEMAANQRVRDGVRMFAVPHVIVRIDFSTADSTYSYRYGWMAFRARISNCSYRLGN